MLFDIASAVEGATVLRFEAGPGASQAGAAGGSSVGAGADDTSG